MKPMSSEFIKEKLFKKTQFLKTVRPKFSEK